MGKNNSSSTRVVPVFEALAARDPSGGSWLRRLLELGDNGEGHELPSNVGLVEKMGYWGSAERRLAPPRSLLEWMLLQPEMLNAGALASASPTSDTTREKRKLLLQRDEEMMREGLRLLAQDTRPSKKWYVLEGASCPDAYFATPEIVLVIEGKRTEAGSTTETSWMSTRHQMLRHLDGAWEIRLTRRVFGLLIVEGHGGENAIEVPGEWKDMSARTVDPGVLERSLPHRSASERSQISAGYLGVTTWQKVCQTFDLPWVGQTRS